MHKKRRIPISDGINQFVGKVFAGDVKDFGVHIVFNDEVGDGMHQMGFSKSRTSI